MNGNLPVSSRKRNRLCNDNVFGFQFKNMESGMGKAELEKECKGGFRGGGRSLRMSMD